HGDEPVGDLQDRQGLPRAAKDAQNVVLRVGQPILAKKLAEAVLDEVARAQDAHDDFLLRSLKVFLHFQFVFQLFRDHGTAPRRTLAFSLPFDSLTVKYIFAAKERKERKADCSSLRSMRSFAAGTLFLTFQRPPIAVGALQQ